MQNETMVNANHLNEPLGIREVIQAGDVFLLRTSCPRCSADLMGTVGQIICKQCRFDFSQFPIIDPGRGALRCLSGTRRKRYILKSVMRALVQMSENMCSYCACALDERFHVEHTTPISFGGTNNLSNLCLACPECNFAAGSLVFKSFSTKRDFILRKRNYRKGAESGGNSRGQKQG